MMEVYNIILNRGRKGLFLIVVLFLVFSIGGVLGLENSFSGTGGSADYVNPARYQQSFQTYYSSSDLQTYWPILDDKESCRARQDMILQVAPGGCQPNVVRSDLLAEQNVPVFCQINALKLNPLINIKEINYVRFSGKYPKDVISAGYHPAKAALRTRDKLLGSPLIDNIGYAVVVLKKNEKEAELPDFVTINLSGKIEYEGGNALGIGKAEFLLKQQSDDEWESSKDIQSFWNGRYFIRLERADPESADVSIYRGDRKVSSVRAEKGKVSREIYLPGFYCQAGLEVSYDGFKAAEKSARIEVGDEKGNDVIEVYEGSRIINDKCTIEKINIEKGRVGEEVKFIENGKVDDGTIGRILDSGKYELVVSGKKKIVNSEDIINSAGKNLGFGSVTINCGYKEKFVLKLGNRFNVGESVEYKSKEAVIQSVGKNDKYVIQNREGGEVQEVEGKDLKFKGSLNDTSYEREVDEAFDSAIRAYEEIAENYPAEKINSAGGERYGEKALEGAIELASIYGKTGTESRLINKFLDLYPDSERAESFRSKLNSLYSIDSTLAGNVVYIDNKFRTIKLLGLDEPEKKASAEFIIGGINEVNSAFSVELKESKNAPSNSKSVEGVLGRVELKSLESERATITAYCTDSRARVASTGKDYSLRINERISGVCGQSIILNKVNLEEVARIRLIPQAKRLDNEVNLSVSVGIEKRAIKLSPEKTEEMISNLNKSIEKWDSISKNLGNVVSGLKAACFATSAVLQAKTFLTGLSGEGAARQMVMRGEKGWNNRCQEIVSKGDASSLNDCYLKNANDINRDVKATAESMKGINDKIKAIENPLKKSGGAFGVLGLESSVDRSVSASRYAEHLVNDYKGQLVPDKEGKLVPIESIINAKGGYDRGEYSYDDLKRYEMYLKIKESGASEGIKKSYELDAKSASGRIDENLKRNKEVDDARALEKLGYPPALSTGFTNRNKASGSIGDVSNLPQDIKDKFGSEKIDGTATLAISDYKSGSGKSEVNFDRGTYILGLEKRQNGEYGVKKILHIQDGKFVRELDSDKRAKFNNVFGTETIVSEKNIIYNNPYKNPEVKYFETEPYKGMPAVVPFDTARGWYAATKQNLPVFGGIGAFESNGRVASFNLCNVGEDKREQFQEGQGDDICEVVNLNTGQPLNKFPGLDEKQARDLIGKATKALTDAANQYGQPNVRIAGESFRVGKPAMNIPNVQCQDFMDPKDCHLMFNVCDPVICPASRCDLGGRYPVSDVIQTGIVGSTLLCLPNIKEKIYAPVCLTGIHAGVDSYNSILKAHRDCLQESISTGRSVGICDQIYSIYSCEFFWRQVAPVSKVLLPKLLESVYGGSAPRGGGEYLTVAGAWQNTQKSIDYFTNTYAVNSLKAFRIRSIEEAGTPFCKAFVSARGPKTFESLIEPDSPPQFYSWFSSTKYSDATVPATAQYKVFYHIFSGKDSGVNYRVYLKGAPDSYYYYSNHILPVSSGFVNRGDYRTETKDFTAPEGYKELCVDINGEEKCGFKQVSTDFSVNYLRDKYAKEQIEARDIVSEKECIAGKPSLGALLANTNPQAAFEESAIPENYERGIIRICASKNPGSSTDSSRFVDVGYCDSEKMRCWLDKESVKKGITENNKYLQNETLSNIGEIQRKTLEDKGDILSSERANEQIGQFRREVDFIIAKNFKGADNVLSMKAEVYAEIKKMDDVFGGNLEMLFFNHHKAEVLFMKAQLKRALAEVYLNKGKKESSNLRNTINLNGGKIAEEFKVGDEVLYKGGRAIIQGIDGEDYVVQPRNGEPENAKRSDLSIIVSEGSETGNGPETGAGSDSEKNSGDSLEVISGPRVDLSRVNNYNDLKEKVPYILSRYFREEVAKELKFDEIKFVDVDNPITEFEKQQAKEWSTAYGNNILVQKPAADVDCPSNKEERIIIKIDYSNFVDRDNDKSFVGMIIHEILHCVSRYHFNEIGYSKLNADHSQFNAIYMDSKSSSPFDIEYNKIESILSGDLYRNENIESKNGERFSYLGSDIAISKDYSNVPSYEDVIKYSQRILILYNGVLRLDDLIEGYPEEGTTLSDKGIPETATNQDTEKNIGDTISLSETYNPSSPSENEIDILLNPKSTNPEIYIKLNRVFIRKDYWFDTNIGSIVIANTPEGSGGKIRLLDSAKSKLGEELFKKLNNALIIGSELSIFGAEGDKIIESDIKQGEEGSGFGKVAKPPSKSELIPQ